MKIIPLYPPSLRDKIIKGKYNTAISIICFILVLGLVFVNGFCNGKFALEERQRVNKNIEMKSGGEAF